MTTIAIAADNHDNDNSVIISYLNLQKYFNVRQLTNVNVNVIDDMTTKNDKDDKDDKDDKAVSYTHLTLPTIYSV